MSESRNAAIERLSKVGYFYVEIANETPYRIDVTKGEPFGLSFFKYFCHLITNELFSAHSQHLVPIIIGNKKIEVINRAAIHVKFLSMEEFDYFSNAICKIVGKNNSNSNSKSKSKSKSKKGGKNRLRRHKTRRHA